MSRNSSATQGPGDSINLEGILHAQIVTKQVIVAFLACTVWEMIITVDQDIGLFWKKRWTLAKFMFYFNRIGSILTMALNMLNSSIPSPSGRFCIASGWIWMAATSSLIAVINYTLLSRAYALWNLSRRILVVCIFSFIFNVGLYIGPLLYLLATSSATGAAPPFTGCQLSSSFKDAYWFFIVALIFESGVFILIVIKSYPIVRLRGVKAPLYSLLFQDGLAFYCAMLTTQILVLASSVKPSPATIPILASSPSIFVIGIASNRLLLRSQQLLQDRSSDLSFSFPSRSFAVAAGITTEFRHEDDSRPADYSTGEDLELVRTRQEEKVAKTHRAETGGPPMQSLETSQKGRDRSISPTTCEA